MSDETTETTVDESASIPPPAPRRPMWRDIALGLVILLCGAIIGVCGMILLGGRGHFDPRMRPEPDLDAVVPRMLQSLNLTSAQRETIRPIVREHVERVIEIRNQSRQEAVAELRAMEEEVVAELTPEQVQRWKQVLESYRRLGAPKGRRWGGENRGGGMGRGQSPGQGPGSGPGFGQGQGRGRGGPGWGGKRDQPEPPPGS